MNVLLATTDHERTKYKNMVNNFTEFFNKSQGSFIGEKKTYTPREDTIDEPTLRGFTKITTTVKEKLDYFLEESKGFIDALFAQEKTNALGLAKAELVINGESWGEYTSLELLRLKNLLESADLGNLQLMFTTIPVRSDRELWYKCTDDEYKGRDDIVQNELVKGVKKTTTKKHVILEDPNIKHLKDSSGYTPVTDVRTETQELGDYTYQRFSGEFTHAARAAILKRRSDMILAVIEALKKANECHAVPSELTAEKIFNHLFFGK